MSRLSIINLAELPAMQVIETLDSDAIITARMLDLKTRWALSDPPAAAQYDVENLEFDPLKINQEVSAYFETLLRDRVNQAARSVTLAFATGGDLDAIASRYPGGVPRLVGETDDHYRRRVWLSPNTLSPHGTAEAYVFWALTADPTLRDASAVTHEGTGNIYVTIMAEGVEPRPTLQQIAAVQNYIYQEARRGKTDVVVVYPPNVVHVTYKIRVWLFPNVSAELTMPAIDVALAALIEKQRWLGYDHSRMAIDAAVAQVGVHHCVIDEPVKDVLVDDRAVIKVDAVHVVLAGRAE